jgi:hypothetical protein
MGFSFVVFLLMISTATAVPNSQSQPVMTCIQRIAQKKASLMTTLDSYESKLSNVDVSILNGGWLEKLIELLLILIQLIMEIISIVQNIIAIAALVQAIIQALQLVIQLIQDLIDLIQGISNPQPLST